ncbi:hypothetical protein MES5069_270237 [Mesorhizobium escarrei]|uniref:Uncharacterized protein n=1 Tax=Mesorhizobium escarrei TaxID=666018 RepID=A0ABM9DXW6_9HYPH|nr:hypothetical protein MES5069_270237 [Mesorhizobium escarrei]
MELAIQYGALVWHTDAKVLSTPSYNRLNSKIDLICLLHPTKQFVDRSSQHDTVVSHHAAGVSLSRIRSTWLPARAPLHARPRSSLRAPRGHGRGEKLCSRLSPLAALSLSYQLRH